jgi:hypothetical protein
MKFQVDLIINYTNGTEENNVVTTSNIQTIMELLFSRDDIASVVATVIKLGD